MAHPSADVLRVCAEFIRPSSQFHLWEDTDDAEEVRAMLGMNCGPPDAVLVRRAMLQGMGLSKKTDESAELRDFLNIPYPFERWKMKINVARWRWWDVNNLDLPTPNDLWYYLGLVTVNPILHTSKKMPDGQYFQVSVSHLVERIHLYAGSQYMFDICHIKQLCLLTTCIEEEIPINLDNILEDIESYCRLGSRSDAFDHAFFFSINDICQNDPRFAVVLVECMKVQCLREAVAKDPQVSQMVHRRIRAYQGKPDKKRSEWCLLF